MSLTFNVTVTDTIGGFASYIPLIQTDLAYAGSIWSSYMTSSASIEVQVNITQTSSNTANGTAATSSYITSNLGNDYWRFGTIQEIIGNGDPNGAAADVIINIDPDYINTWVYFDPNPSPSSSVPSNKVDAVELFEHELGHALGFNGFLDWATGIPTQNDYSTFDVYVQMISGKPYFVGPYAEAVYGGPVPLTAGNLYHIGNSTGAGSELLNDIMNGVVGPVGKSVGPSLLDRAILRDSGLPMNFDMFAPSHSQLSNFGQSQGWGSESGFPRTVGDLNHDGKFDIIGFGQAGVWVSLANSGGGYSAASFQLSNFGQAQGWSSDALYHRTVGDVNGDGFADIVGFGQAGVYVALGNGAGGFGAASFKLANFGQAQGWSSSDLYSRVVGDVNGDGKADIVGFGQAGVWVSLGNATGGFGAATFQLSNFGQAQGWSSDNTYHHALADVNGDHRADIVGFGQSGVWVALGNASGGFGTASLQLSNFGQAQGWSSDNTYHRDLGDVNGDGLSDIVGFGQSGVLVALAAGGGAFGSANLKIADFAPGAGGWTSNDLFPRFVGDANGDLHADIIGFGQSGVQVSTWLV